MQAGHLWPQMRKTGDYRLSGNLLFCLLVAPAPKPLFRRISFCGYAPFRRFSLPPLAEFFRKWRGWLISIISNCPVKGNGTFSKNPSGSQSRSQRETLFKGFGMLPNKQNLRFPATLEIAGLSVCIYKRPACPVAHGCCFHRPSTKFSPKALTGTSVCATIMEN